MRRASKSPRKKAYHPLESDGLQAGDGIGNRQKFSQNRISADDVGNRLPAAEQSGAVRDDIGNFIGTAPTHEQSGVLAGFESRGRRRKESSENRNSSYMVGGVNPLVSGSHALMSMHETMEDKERYKSGESEAQDGRTSSRETSGAGRGRRSERSSDSSDRWLKRLLEFEDDDRGENVTSPDAKQKAHQAREVLGEVFEKVGIMAAIGTEVVTESASGKQSVIVSFEDIDLSAEPSTRLSNVFATGSLSLLALNFLVNKIVNRVPEERVRVQVLLREPGAKVDSIDS